MVLSWVAWASVYSKLARMCKKGPTTAQGHSIWRIAVIFSLADPRAALRRREQLVKICKRVALAKPFQNFVTLVILFAGVLVGIETYPDARASYGGALHVLDIVVLTIFVIEIAIKMIAEGKRPWRYFFDPWNVFDFTIVAAAFLPFASEYATVLRLLRLLRVLRLVRALPKLQLLVGALLKSIPSMGYVAILMLLLFYVYAVAGVFMWGENDPVHFRDLETAMVSLFRTVTLEDWTDMMYINMYGCDEYGYAGSELCKATSAAPLGSAIFFISFVLFGTMIVLNLFIGVILGGMSEAQQEADEADRLERLLRQGTGETTLQDELAALSERLDDLQQRVGRAQRLAKGS
jgi:voltage-gated sodium channel